jgi:UDP-N-acetylmuramate--alanine ligase
VPRLVELFGQFAAGCRRVVVVGADCPRAAALRVEGPRVHSFGLDAGQTRAEHVQLGPGSASFVAAGTEFRLPVGGLHNVKNALAVIAAARELGLDLAEVAAALGEFRGLRRRMELVGTARGVEVYDDYAHNPDKLAAVLASTAGRRRFVLFQPHGYGPTRFLLRELAEALAKGTHGEDRVLILPIYDAGGTTDRSVGAEDLARAVQDEGGRAQAPADRAEAVRTVAEEARSGDCVLVLGARDSSLTRLARDIVSALPEA